MKAAKIAAAIIVGIVAIFLSGGLLLPVVKYSSTVMVNAPAEKCWTVFQDTSRMAQWTEGFQSLKRIRGDSLEAGAIYEMIIVQDERMTMTEQMLEVVKPARMVFELNNDVLKSICRYEFKPHGNVTEITSTFAVTGNNIFWRSLFVYFQTYFKAENEKQMQELKRVIEASH